MDTTIDTLAIEIETETSGSTKSIDTIISKLNKLNTTLIESSKAVNAFKTSVSSLNSIKINNIKMPKIPKLNETTATGSAKSTRSLIDTGSTTNLANATGTFATDKATTNVKQTTSQVKSLENALSKSEARANRLAEELENIKNSGNKASNAGRKLSVSMKGLSSSNTVLRKLSTNLKKTFSASLTGSVRKFGLALLGVRSLFTATRSAVQEYMNYDTELRDTLSNNWAVLGSLIAPILEKVIKLFGLAVAYIRAFVKALTGIDLVAKANSKAMRKLSESAKDTLGNLAKFDDLNVVEFPEADSSDSLKPLTTPEIDTKNLDWFVKYIKEGNWYGLGMEIGRMFNDGLRTIDFEWFTEKAREWAKNIGDLFNGLTDGTDWNLLGEKIAGGLNTAFAFVNTFFDTYNWNNLGTSLATGLNSMFDTVNWNDIGQFFSNKLASVVDVLYNFVTTFDWAGLGDGIATAITRWFLNIDWAKMGEGIVSGITGMAETLGTTFANIKWDKVAHSISNGIVGALNSAIDFLQNTDWSEVATVLYEKIGEFITNINWDGIVSKLSEGLGSLTGALISLLAQLVAEIATSISDYFSQFIDAEGNNWLEIGGNIIAGIFEGIINAIANIGVWIYDNILVPFINGFKEAFDIHSPSKVMEEQGSFVLEGFLNAFANIKNLVKDIWNQAKTAISEKITEIINNMKNFFSKKNMETIFNTAKTAITTKFNDIKNNIKTKMSEAWIAVKNTFSISNIASHFQKIFNKIKSIFTTIGTTVGNAVGNSFANVINTVIGFVENTINKFIKAINKAIGVINEIPGVNIKKLDTINIPDVKLATGTNRIESEGLYHLHKNEAVVPEKYNPAVNDDLYNNKGVIEALGRVYDAINNLDITNVVNVGNKTLYKETINYAKKQNQMYGENIVAI